MLYELSLPVSRKSRRASYSDVPAIVRVEELEERILLAVPGVIISPVNGTGWTDALGSPGHTETGGIGGADDRNAHDMNLNTPTWDADRGVPVYAIADGFVERDLGGGHWGGSGYGQLLLKHYNADGSAFYSGYLHMTNITGLKATHGTFIRAGTQIGNVGNVSRDDPNLPYHLHFAVYEWDGTKLRSRASTIQQVTARPNSAAPANDNFSNRASINSGGGTVTGSNVGATPENGEPNAAGVSGTRSVWWTWTPAVSGTAVISTAGSDFDTTLGVFGGSAVSSLARIADNDDASGTLQSRVAFAAVAGTTYQILVNGYGSSAGKISLNVAMSAASPAPTAPGSFTANAISSSQVRLSWSDSANETQYRVYQWNGSSAVLIATLAANSTNYTVSGLAAGQTYYFYLEAFNNVGRAATNWVGVTTQAASVTPPAAPTNVAWRATSSTTGYLTWSDNAYNELGFRLQYWSGSSWVTFDTVSANTTVSRTYALQRGVYYYLRVVAYHAAGETPSNHVTVLM